MVTEWTGLGPEDDEDEDRGDPNDRGDPDDR